MVFRRKYILYTSVLLIALCEVSCRKSLQFSADGTKLEDTIEKYFPKEHNLCVVLAESLTPLPTFHVPVVIFTPHQVLEDCRAEPTDRDGYVLMTSNTTSLQNQIVPILNCFDRTNLKLKTKYVLIIDSTEDSKSNRYEAYTHFFLNVWNVIGIINVAIIPTQDQSKNSKSSLILSYNPFLSRQNLSLEALKINSLTKDIRGIMIDRFHNMHGYPLKTVVYNEINTQVGLGDPNEKGTLGADPGILFKQILEEKLNISFDVHEIPNDQVYGSENNTNTGLVGEFSSGKAEYCLNFMLLPPGVSWSRYIEPISIDFSMNMIFIVPKPREIESWQLFLYIFQWQVCVGVGLVLCLLSAAALLFQYVHSTRITPGLKSSGTSEVVSVWKAALSVSINKLPTTHSQRSLIAWSLILGLIFLTLFSVQLFALVKSKPRIASIKSLQDLHDSNLPIYVRLKPFLQYLNPFENTTLHNLKDNLKSDKEYDSLQYLNPIHLNVTDRAVLYTDSMIDLITSQPHNKVFLQCFDVVKEPIFQASLQTNVPFGSVYFDHFNSLCLKLMSGGIFHKWYKASNHKNVELFAALSPPRTHQESHKTDADHVTLSYDNLKIAFYVLYFGLIVSVICFITELLY